LYHPLIKPSEKSDTKINPVQLLPWQRKENPGVMDVTWTDKSLFLKHNCW